jgi:hypothetical protein
MALRNQKKRAKSTKMRTGFSPEELASRAKIDLRSGISRLFQPMIQLSGFASQRCRDIALISAVPLLLPIFLDFWPTRESFAHPTCCQQFISIESEFEKSP